MDINNEAINVLASTIIDAIKQIIKSADYDRTLIGRITDINDSIYSVNIRGETYQIKSSLQLKLGCYVYVVAPCNDWSNLFISGIKEV